MTAKEVMRVVRMFLDDERDDSIPLYEKVRAINEAQLRLVQKYHLKDDDYSLRTLYCFLTSLRNGALVGFYPTPTANIAEPLLYTKACKLHETSAVTEANALMAEYVDYPLFFNYNQPVFDLDDRFPRVAWYTIKKGFNSLDGNFQSNIYFTDKDGNARASIWFIRTPVKYSVINDVTLELPPELHIEVCAEAAEILNDIDVGEMERSETAYQNQKLTISDTGQGGMSNA